MEETPSSESSNDSTSNSENSSTSNDSSGSPPIRRRRVEEQGAAPTSATNTPVIDLPHVVLPNSPGILPSRRRPRPRSPLSSFFVRNPEPRLYDRPRPAQQPVESGSVDTTAHPIVHLNSNDIETQANTLVGLLRNRRPGRNIHARRRTPTPLSARMDVVSTGESTTGPSTFPPLTPALAVSKEVVESFGQNGLLENQEDEITEIEEMSFQKVLRRKMVCEVCITHMKLFRCRKCMYSMCQECTDKITQERPGNAICPHCREEQQNFIQIVLPRL